MKYTSAIVISVVLSLVFEDNLFAQKRRKTQSVKVTKDSSPVAIRGKLVTYGELITDKAVTTEGLFKIHLVNDRYYFEIPSKLFDRELLVVNRINKAASDRNNDRFGFAGDLAGNCIIQFTKAPQHKVFIRTVANVYRSEDSSENGLHRALVNSSIQSIVAAFDINAISPDSTSFVLDFTDFLNSDNTIFGVNDVRAKTWLLLGSLQQDKSFIQSIHNFQSNVEIKTLKTYDRPRGTASIELNSSILLLPEIPMRSRQDDKRIGFYSLAYLDFDQNPQRALVGEKILKRRLEPKPGDRERYLRGELVEPQTPIIFYIDPATPKKWVPYLVAGVKDWQKAFEKAGFKNAIYAKEAPVNDPNWDINDARYNVIVYKPSSYENANGPNIHDPRTGEILESHISWFHNILKLVHEWYFIQASPIDPRARKMQFDDDLMGSLIRFVCSHEVGHTLGLKHNFGASSTVPVDSLRSKTYLAKHGLTPSIMDYARFNYVAQPGDDIPTNLLVSKIGEYDLWAIEWGYRWLPEFESEAAEKKYVNKWIVDRTSENKSLFYGTESTPADPRCQSEDLGDDPIKAGEYGIANLKYIMKHLLEWTSVEGETYENLETMHAAVVSQFKRYLGHALKNIGGQYYYPKTVGEPGTTREFVPKKIQKATLKFLNEQLFKTPLWIADKKIFLLTGAVSEYQITGLQKPVIEQLLSQETYSMFMFSNFASEENYNYTEYLSDLRSIIFEELYAKRSTDRYRRNLQKIYVNALIAVVKPIETTNSTAGNLLGSAWNDKTDMFSIVKGEYTRLMADIKANMPFIKDQQTRLHLSDVYDRLQTAIKY